MRGRRADVVGQDEKGNPGKRKKLPKVADRLRALVEAPALDPADPLSPPLHLNLEEMAGAVRIWHEHVPTLRKRNLVNAMDRHTLAMFCYYLDRFWSAVARIAQDGETQRVKTTSGDMMIRAHPLIKQRDVAASIVFDLSAKFGFTPMDRHKLIREMAGTGVPTGGLFGDEEPQPGAQQQRTPTGDDPDDILGFARRATGQPGGRPN